MKIEDFSNLTIVKKLPNNFKIGKLSIVNKLDKWYVLDEYNYVIGDNYDWIDYSYSYRTFIVKIRDEKGKFLANIMTSDGEILLQHWADNIVTNWNKYEKEVLLLKQGDFWYGLYIENDLHAYYKYDKSFYKHPLVVTREFGELCTLKDSVGEVGQINFNPKENSIFKDIDSEQLFVDSENVVFTQEKRDLVKFPLNYNKNTYDIPNGVKSIRSSVFEHRQLININFPDSLEFIGDCCFYGTYIHSIIIPDSVRCIGQCAFEHCHNLKIVVLSKEIDCITDQFKNCDNLKYIIARNPETINEDLSLTWENNKYLIRIDYDLDLLTYQEEISELRSDNYDTNSNSGYSLEDSYQDAFDGQDDAYWNIE